MVFTKKSDQLNPNKLKSFCQPCWWSELLGLSEMKCEDSGRGHSCGLWSFRSLYLGKKKRVRGGGWRHRVKYSPEWTQRLHIHTAEIALSNMDCTNEWDNNSEFTFVFRLGANVQFWSKSPDSLHLLFPFTETVLVHVNQITFGGV